MHFLLDINKMSHAVLSSNALSNVLLNNHLDDNTSTKLFHPIKSKQHKKVKLANACLKINFNK